MPDALNMNEPERSRMDDVRNAFLSLATKLNAARNTMEAARSIFDTADLLWEWDCGTMDICSAKDGLAHPVLYFDIVDGKRREVPTVMSPDGPTPRIRRIMAKGAELIFNPASNEPVSDTLMFGDVTRPSASLMCVPFRSHGHPVGVFSIQSYTPNAYTGEDLRTLEALADICGGAIDRINAEEALRESEERYRTLVEESPDAIVISQEERLVFVNSTATRQFGGIGKAELLGRKGAEFVHPDDHAAASSRVRRRLAGETGVYPAEVRYVRTDGTIVPVEISGSPVVFGGKPAMQFIIRDITERKQAEQKLTAAHRQSTALVHLGRELAEAVTPRAAALSILHTARQLLDWDSAWLNLWNEEKQRFEDLADFDLADGERREIPPRASGQPPTPMTRRVMREGPQLILRENETDQLNGFIIIGSPRRSLSLMFVPIRYAGRITGILSIQSYQRNAYDKAGLELLQALADHCAGALERIQTTAALRASEERFRLVWESTAEGMRLTDNTGRIVAANDAFRRMIGQPRSRVEGQFMSAVYAEADQARILARHQERFARRAFPESQERRMTLANGRTLWLESTNRFIETDPARPLLLSVFRDITGRKQAEEKLAAQLEELQRWHAVTLGREERVQELKREVNGLLRRQGQPPRYPSQEAP